jgi:hypothetical protein
MFFNGAGGPSSKTVAYDPVAHRFWQISEAGGTVHFATSPDGNAWSELFGAALDFPLTEVKIELSAGVYQPEIAPGFAEFDQLGGTVPLGPSCGLAMKAAAPLAVTAGSAGR